MIRQSVTPELNYPWEELVVEQDGILSPAGCSELDKNDSDEECLDKSENEAMSESENLNTHNYISNTTSSGKQHVTVISNKENKRAIENLRSEQNFKKKKIEPLEQLVHTCTTIGHNINNILNHQNTETDQEDYHFLLSLMEAFKKIHNPVDKLKLKASFLVQVADVIENNK